MNVSSSKRQRADIDMRAFAKSAGATIKVPAGVVVFSKGDTGEHMYIVQSGVIDMVIDDKPRSSTARAREACELSLIDPRISVSWWTRCRTSRPTSWACWRGASAA